MSQFKPAAEVAALLRKRFGPEAGLSLPALVLIAPAATDAAERFDLFICEDLITKREAHALLSAVAEQLAEELEAEGRSLYKKRRAYRPWDHTPGERQDGQ